MKVLVSLIFVFSYSVFAKWTFSEGEQKNILSGIESSCQVKIKKDNAKQICQCIALNHVVQAKRQIQKSKALMQLKWVVDFYKGKISQEEFSKDPFFIGGASGVLFQFDEDCSFDPSYRVSFPE